MGSVMELLFSYNGARTADEFRQGVELLKGEGKTAWTGGTWTFKTEVRDWKGIQNLHRDIYALSQHLCGLVRSGLREKSTETPDLFEDARVA